MKSITTIKLSKKTVELLNKLKIHPRQAYEEVVLGLLKKAKFDKNKKGNFNVSQFLFLFIVASVVISGLFFISGGITGQVVYSEFNNYSQILDLEVNNNSEYVWVLENPGILKSIRLDGLMKKETSARVYIEHNNEKLLIFDSSALYEEASKIAGLVVNENKAKGLETALNKTSNLTLPFNKTLPINETPIVDESTEKTIDINLEYGDNEFYDEDNDGVEDLKGVIDLTVDNTEFNWDVDQNNLCTRWETYSVEDKESTLLCYGSLKCCNFVDLYATKPVWNETFYSVYREYGATSNNIVSAQVLYVDYDLNISDSYAEIYNSEWGELSADYVEQTISFNDICIETCILDNFDDDRYKLIFEVDDGFLDISTIEYTIEEEIDESVEIINKSINVSENLSITSTIISKKKDIKPLEGVSGPIGLKDLGNRYVIWTNGGMPYYINKDEGSLTNINNTYWSKQRFKWMEGDKKVNLPDTGWEWILDSDIDYYALERYYNDTEKEIWISYYLDENSTRIELTFSIKPKIKLKDFSLIYEQYDISLGGNKENNKLLYDGKIYPLNENYDAIILGKAQNYTLSRTGKEIETWWLQGGADIRLKSNNEYNTPVEIVFKKVNIPAGRFYRRTLYWVDAPDLEHLEATACTFSGCSVPNYNDNTTSIGASLAKNNADVVDIAATVDLGASDTINQVDWSFRWTNVVNLDGNWDFIFRTQDAVTEYCTISIAQTDLNEDVYEVRTISSGCTTGTGVNTKARLDDLEVRIRNSDAAGGQTGDVLYVNITIDFTPFSDTTPPGVNITNINESTGTRINDVLNISCQSFDGPTVGNITFNLTGPLDLYNFSFALSGTSANFSQNITMNLTRGNVVNATCWAYDGSNNAAQNSTIITIANRLPTVPTIVNTSNKYFNANQTFNITPLTDDDGDTLTYFWFLNSSTDSFANLVASGVEVTNWTTNTTNDNEYYLFVNVSDGVGNVTGNILNWTYDVTIPIVNTTLNKSLTTIELNDLINITANVTDNIGLSFCQIIINQSGFNEIVNISLDGATIAQCSNKSKVILSAGGVINYTIRVNDSAGNFRTNDTIITVVDLTLPIVNTTLNKSLTSIFQNDIINITANVTDETELANGSIIINDTGFKRFFNFSLEGLTSAQFSQNITVSCAAGCVINFTAWTNDTSGNTRTNDTIITVTALPSLFVNISSPTNNTEVTANTTFTLIANVTCLNADCGVVKGFARYNDSGSSVANLSISFVKGAVPLFINGSGGSKTFKSIIEGTDDDWNKSTFNINVTINPDNITLKINGSNQYPNQTGNFTSQVIDTQAGGNFTLISWTQEVPYQTEIGRAVGDGNSATDEDGFINTSGLVLLFHFNNESGFGEATAEAGLDNKTVDFSVYVNSERSGSDANNGSFFNGATINKTFYNFGGGAAEFDGAGDMINVPHHTSLRLSDMTLEAWVKWRAGSGGFDTIVGRDALVGQQNYLFYIDDEVDPPRLALAMRDTGTIHHGLAAPSGVAPQPGVWTHVVATYDGSTQKIFMNGLEVASENDAFSPHQALSADITIGEGGGAGARLFNGSIDEIAVWNRTLSATEILQHYKRGALRLNLSVRSCDDSACSGESFSETLTNASGIPLNESITPNNRYFQYRATFNTEDVNWTPVLYNVTIDYTTLNPLSCGTMLQNDKCQLNWTINASGDVGSVFAIDVNFSSDDGDVVANDTEDHLIKIVAPPDFTPPIVNTTLNKSLTNILQNDIINITANVTDNLGLANGSIIINDTGFKRFFNFSLEGLTSAQFSQNISVSCAAGCVINFTAWANDTSGNTRTNDTIITVVSGDTQVPIINGTINNTFPKFGEIINATYNITDVGGTLSTGNISINISGPSVQNFSFVLSGTEIQISQNITINAIRGTIINITGFAVDTVGNIAQNSTLITVANTPTPLATIVFPPDDFKTNIQPLDLNVTFAADPDNDVINISYYINGALEQNTIINITFTGADGVYILNVSLFDNVTGAAPSANVTINFTIDTTIPVVNTTLNKSLTNIVFGDVINITANITDGVALSFCQIIINQSGPGALEFVNISLESLTTGQCSNSSEVTVFGSSVINYTIRVNDTAGNFRTNDTIITVVDDIVPIVNTTLNKSLTDILENDIINLTANVTDEVQLMNGSIIINDTGFKRFFNFSLEGLTSAQFSQKISVSCAAGCVINFTVWANDTSGNTRTNDTIIEVAVTPDLTKPRINASIFNVSSPRKGDVINFTANATDNTALDTCIFYMNGTTGGIFKVENESFPTQPTSGQCSQNFTIDLVRGNVINFTALVNDTSTDTPGGNKNQSEQIITVADFKAIVSIGINNSNPKINEVVNVSSNATDQDDLSFCLIKHNGTADGSFTNKTFELSGTDGFCSDPISITLVRGNVINFTIEINDSLGGIIYENSTKVTVANTPAPLATIVFPADNIITNLQPLDLNVTFKADSDNDVINITYYINGVLEQNTITNITFTGADGVYILNVSLFDNVTGAAPSANVTINFTIDTTIPVVNTTLNKSLTNIVFGDVINLTANVTDGVALSFCQIIINQSGPGAIEIINISLEGLTTGQCSNSSPVTVFGGSVINYTIRVNDTAGNFRTNDTIITVVDDIVPVVNGTLNKSLNNILQNDIINATFNTTDEVELSNGTIIINDTGFKRFFNFSLKGKTAAEFSQNFTVSCSEGCVVNVTGRVNDTSGNLRQNETIFTVTSVDLTPPGVKASLNKSLTSIFLNDIINITANITDTVELLSANITYNMSGILTKVNFSISGTLSRIHNVTRITVGKGEVINFTVYATDTNNNVKQNSTKITVVNTPPETPIILLPNNDQRFNSIPIQLNVTFAADNDGDSITINYYIDGKINTSSGVNTTFNASDGVYILNVSLFDTEDSSANVTINFTIDTTIPVVNTTLNKSLTNIGFGDVINLTANVTDNLGLSFCQIIINQSGPGAIEIINISLEGLTTGQCSNSSEVTVFGGSVINYSIRVNDSAGNFRTNDTIITVVDDIVPIVNTTLNKSLTSILQNDIINLTANVTDEVQLMNGSIIVNDTGFKRFFNFSLEGLTSAQFSQKISVSCAAGCVINFTVWVNDTSGNTRTNDTIIEVAITPDTTKPRINASIFNVSSPRKGDVINFTANATDNTALDTCIFYMNGTTGGIFKVENESFPTQPTSGQCSQNWTIDLIRGNVINFTTVVNDTSTNVAGGNLNQSEQIITVADFIATVSIGINNSAPKINEVINVSSNTTDLDNLAWCLIKHNGTADGSFTNNTFELSGTDGFCSDPISITLVRGNVINFTIEINDSLGGIIYENSTKVTVTNTPAPQASIIFPPDDFKTNKLPLDLNVTFAADPDNDVINITYYIDGKINQTQIELNTTFNASDGVYILNVSLHDNVIPVEYSINVTINFTIDTVVPVVNTSLNQTTNIGFGDVINLTANVTDGVDLSFCQIIINQSGPNDLEFINISLSGTTGQCSKSSTVTLVGGNVINYTIRVNDTAGNFRTNDTIITVVDKIAPVINGTLNKSLSNILQNDVINVSFNATDEIELSDGTIIINETGFNRYFNFSLEGKTAAGFSQNFTINCTAGCVINVTGRVNDTSGNIKQNETIFTVTEEEIPPGTTTTTTTTGGGGGGGARGGGIVLPKKDFSVDLNTIKSSILQGETKTTTLRVKNTGGTKLQFSVEIQNLGKFIEVSDDSFELGPDESKTITFSFTASENELPDVYSGKIVIKADGIEKSIITIIEVTERKALFDVSIAVDKNYKKVLKDQEVKIDIDLTNLGTLAPVDVELFYAIKDLDENIIVFKTESLAVNDRLTVSRSLQIPNDLEVGKYIVYVRVLYNDQIAASSDLFEVVDILPGLGGLGAIKTIGTIVLALVLLLLVINGLYYSDILREQQREQLQRKVQEFLAKRKEKIITRPKERVLETKEGLQILLEKPKQKISKVMETIKVVPRKTPEQRIISEKELEIRKISSQIEEWEKKGYDSTMLELEIKALEDKELGKQIEKLKEWKSKGYNTFILEEKIKNNYKKDLMRK